MKHEISANHFWCMPLIFVSSLIHLKFNQNLQVSNVRNTIYVLGYAWVTK